MTFSFSFHLNYDIILARITDCSFFFPYHSIRLCCPLLFFSYGRCQSITLIPFMALTSTSSFALLFFSPYLNPACILFSLFFVLYSNSHHPLAPTLTKYTFHIIVTFTELAPIAPPFYFSLSLITHLQAGLLSLRLLLSPISQPITITLNPYILDASCIHHISFAFSHSPPVVIIVILLSISDSISIPR